MLMSLYHTSDAINQICNIQGQDIIDPPTYISIQATNNPAA